MTISYTMDVNFDNIEHLNAAIEETKEVLENLRSEKRLKGYYLMRYVNTKEIFLGIKILFDDSENITEVITEIKNKLQEIDGYNSIRQDKSEGEISNSLPLLCSEAMQLRNKVWNILGRKATDEEFIHLMHYLANPLLLNNEDELRILQQRIKQLEGDR